MESPWLFFLGVALLALVGALAEKGLASLKMGAAPVAEAAWIWAPDVARQEEPVAFLAVRDFRLEEMPERALLTVAADEDYVAFVNGLRVGGGSFRQSMPAHAYDVTSFLKLAGNRLVFELRSSRGAGGLAARLDFGGTRPAVMTDSEWQIFRQHDPLIQWGGFIPEGLSPQVWNGSPTGRWRPLPAAEPRPTPGFTFPPRLPHRATQVMVPESGMWNDLKPFTKGFPELGERVLLDWGEEVTGVLVLDLARRDGTPGYAYFGATPPHERSPPADTLILPLPGAPYWLDAHVRTFRYVWLVGVDLSRVPEVLPIPADDAALLRPPPAERGVFGVVPPRADTLAEERIRQRLVAPTAPNAVNLRESSR